MSNESMMNCYIASQILGDGHLVGDSIVIAHDEKWVDYLEWKRSIAEALGFNPTSVRRWSPIITNVGLPQNRVAITMNVPTYYITTCPISLIKRLTPIGLLLWWLDDGCMIVHEKNNGVSIARFGYLCTEAFDKETNYQMAQALFDSFGLSVAVHIDRGSISNADMVYYRLYFNATALRALIDIVRPFVESVPISIRYKLNMDYRPNRLKSSESFSQLYNF